jgi:hypothetical protein
VEIYLNSPNAPPWRCAQLKYRDNFTLSVKERKAEEVVVAHLRHLVGWSGENYEIFQSNSN